MYICMYICIYVNMIYVYIYVNICMYYVEPFFEWAIFGDMEAHSNKCQWVTAKERMASLISAGVLASSNVAAFFDLGLAFAFDLEEGTTPPWPLRITSTKDSKLGPDPLGAAVVEPPISMLFGNKVPNTSGVAATLALEVILTAQVSLSVYLAPVVHQKRVLAASCGASSSGTPPPRCTMDSIFCLGSQ